MRGILALTVALSHFYGSITGYSTERPLIGAALAVDYFFVLSGYVLTHQLVNSTISLKEHIKNRILRLAPLNSLAILMVLFIVFYNSLSGGYVPDWYQKLTAEIFLANIMLLTHAGLMTFEVINAPAWSISVEFIVSTFFLYSLVKFGSPKAALSIIILLVVYFLTIGGDLRVDSSIGGLARGILGITLGYFAYNIPQEIFMNKILYIAARCAFWVSLLFVFMNHPRFDLLAVASFVFSTIWLTANEKGIEKRVLSSPVFAFLGGISFSIYLLHTPILLLFAPAAIAQAIGEAPSIILLTGITITLSTIVFQGFEKPTRSLFKYKEKK